jgi:hypothetical protein
MRLQLKSLQMSEELPYFLFIESSKNKTRPRVLT